jgi:maltooligosyltrehalose trehalohydrolase
MTALRLGACRTALGYRFEVWAPARQDVELLLHPAMPGERRFRLDKDADGYFSVTVPEARAGDRYAYRLDGEGPFPDPASRYQPAGVHGASQIVDPSRFNWSDAGWRGVPLDDAVVYELHVGTFTPEGSFAAAIDRLPYLVDLGATLIELMPVGDFPGSRNWGYDGVDLFAPARCYGGPDDLRRLVDAAHAAGLGVLLDVVYNHFGPDGAYLNVFSPYYLSGRHRTPWGAAVNLDAEHSAHVRRFFIESALHWLTEYHFDGLRLDATHGFVDESDCHFARELSGAVRGAIHDRTVLLIAEDERNLATIVQPLEAGGWGMDAVWADDFHHQIRRHTAGDRDGYYEDYTGSLEDLAAGLRQGWFYCGQHSAYLGKPRGTDPCGVALNRMVICLQNHDQVGNRPFGARLHHSIDAATYRAASAVLLFAPETPLLFMGQEWAASTPFLYFTDHHEELGRAVTEGRRREFARFTAFADEATRARIPDPQAHATFAASRLNWADLQAPAHAAILRLYRALLALRRTVPALRGPEGAEVVALDGRGLAIRRRGGAEELLLLACLRVPADVHARHGWPSDAGGWRVVLTTEDEAFVADDEGEPQRPAIAADAGPPAVTFHRPGAVVFRRVRSADAGVRATPAAAPPR